MDFDSKVPPFSLQHSNCGGGRFKWIAANTIECSKCGKCSLLVLSESDRLFVDFAAYNSPISFSAS